jgi:UDP:flavonoid glycosyltransferase YjiC (YdhE family)
VTEALTAGLPVLAAPFSTDQFAGAEDLRRAGLGDALDPSTASAHDIAAQLASLLDGDAASRAAALGAELRRAPGARLAAEIVESVAVTPAVAA